MSKKSYAKREILRVMSWILPICTVKEEDYEKEYYKDKEFKFKELKKFFVMYLGLIKDGRKKDALRDC